MKVLLIDNETKLLNELKELIPDHETVRRWNEKYDDHEEYDLIVLSGGSRFSVVGSREGLKGEIDLIKKTKKPVIGICFGAELIVVAFDGSLKKMTTVQHGLRQIYTKSDHFMFGGRTQFTVGESHQWTVEDLPKNFEVLAESSHGIEIFQHRNRLIYGFQFHPEAQLSFEGGNVFQLLLSRLFPSL